ncbi:P-loop containing nucleoside triphosphate hydrolase [Glarea lozoyensis ATCC 20868]|nr:P-loop containing nucleoside triphosphate hydrolase [Glarea lozoyensis ATCC 20868]EPE25845.1 P-loop containing nucleoside triphosphate hydrolase [Glarea lozoyensis ATCC 20868]
MAPTEHGECFVLDDGGEVDLDLGNYERYLNITLTRESNITTGKIYQHVIAKERRGDYLGKTVQVVPHLTDAVQDWIERVARIPVDDTKECPDICIIELGGTVGDIESAPFIEAMRQLKRRAGKGNFAQIHVSLVPVIAGEQKTKPTQQAIRDVGRAGLVPDLIACRCDVPLETSTIEKIAMFCQVEPEQVLAVHNVHTTYHVPLLLEKQGILKTLGNILNLDAVTKSQSLVELGQRTWKEWRNLTSQQERLYETVTIALVGKYVNLHDSYLSTIKALEHSAMRCGQKLNLLWIDASDLEEETREKRPVDFHKAWHCICTAQGILVPGGFGERGIEGMIAAAKYARENKRPYLGICLGMQIAVVEFARNICGLPHAASEEVRANAVDKVVIYMPEIDKDKLGGTMRLGLRPTIFQEGSEWSRLRKMYGESSQINERHRHRYEVNPAYVERLSEKGFEFIGKDDKGERMEIIELKDHPWFVGVQFHPEYLSRVLQPSKPYLGFVAAAAGCLEKVTADCLRDYGVHGVDGVTNGLNGVRI